MYKYLDVDSPEGQVRHILLLLNDGGTQSFPDVESNVGPERRAYLEWLAEGNQPEPWQAEEVN
jgi:hypothetical protein